MFNLMSYYAWESGNSFYEGGNSFSGTVLIAIINFNILYSKRNEKWLVKEQFLGVGTVFKDNFASFFKFKFSSNNS